MQFNNDERTHEFMITIKRDADSGNLEETPDTTPDTTRPKLTNKQKDIVNFCSIPRSSREILERAGVKYHNTNIKKYVTYLVNAGYLERTIPERPFDMNQKYRKIDKTTD